MSATTGTGGAPPPTTTTPTPKRPMKLIFVASAFRAPTPWQVAENVRHAERLALEVWKLGGVAVCPQSMSALFDKEGPDERYLEGWLTLLEKCDAVLVGRSSAGVDAEVLRASMRGIPVHWNINSLRHILPVSESEVGS